jgi:predicted lipoprotein
MKLLLTKKTFILTSCCLLVVFLTFISCENEGVYASDDEANIQYLRQEQLRSAYVNEIIPLNLAFITSTEKLKNAITSFKAETTLENLTKAQLQWLETLKIWKHLELYNLGDIEDSFIHFEINRWPTNIENINGFINNTETINENFISTIGSSSKGISAIEYLLFSNTNNNIVLNSFNADKNSQKRLDYLEALSLNLNTKATQLHNLWINYETNFLQSLENGISGSQSQLTNAIITLIEEIVISKLGNPLGDKTGGIIDVNALESYRSNSSLIIIEEHLKAIIKCYHGNYNEKTLNWGYNNYLELIGQTSLNNEIIAAFELCKSKIEAISNPLSIELVNNRQNVADLQNAFTNLLILIKVDMANAIGTTVTINDNDGD